MFKSFGLKKKMLFNPSKIIYIIKNNALKEVYSFKYFILQVGIQL